MTTKQENFDFKSVYMVIVALSILALLFTVQPAALYASSNNDNDDSDNDDSDNDNNDNDNDNSGSDNNDGSNSNGRSRDDLISQLCRYIGSNPALAEMAASLLGFPGGAGAAASVLCSLGN